MLTPIAPTTPAAATAAPLTRRRLLAVEVYIDKAGEFMPLDVRLPETALSITGVYAAATPYPGRLFQRRDAFVIFGDGTDATRTRSAPAGTAAQRDGLPLTVEGVLLSGYGLADGRAAFNPAVHVGFHESLTDEVPLQEIVVPAGLTMYYAHTVSIGLPKLVDRNGDPLGLTTEAGAGKVQTLFSQVQGASAGGPGRARVNASLAYLCRVTPPGPNTDPREALFGEATTGYRTGVLFPGDASRF